MRDRPDVNKIMFFLCLDLSKCTETLQLTFYAQNVAPLGKMSDFSWKACRRDKRIMKCVISLFHQFVFKIEMIHFMKMTRFPSRSRYCALDKTQNGEDETFHRRFWKTNFLIFSDGEFWTEKYWKILNLFNKWETKKMSIFFSKLPE